MRPSLRPGLGRGNPNTTKREKGPFILSGTIILSDFQPGTPLLFKATELESPITEIALVLVGGNAIETHALGSGVFIAARLAITAKHVVEEFWNRLASGNRFEGERPLEGAFSILAVQFPGPSSEPALWLVSFVWCARFTDIAVLAVTPANDLAERYAWAVTPRLNLMPPSPGERVVAFGYAASAIEIAEAGQMRLSLHPSSLGGRLPQCSPSTAIEAC